MAYLLERDAINGKEGRAFCTINGRQIEMFGLKKIQVDCNLTSYSMIVRTPTEDAGSSFVI